MVGDRIWVYQKQAGYVGTGIVTQQNSAPDTYSYAVGVKWNATVPLKEAKTMPGAYRAQPNRSGCPIGEKGPDMEMP
jgi:hypothetical protein